MKSLISVHLVYGVFLIDTVATAMSVGDFFHWFGSGFGNMSALDDVFLSGFDTPMLGAFVAAIVQGVYAFRIWKLEHRYWTSPICVLIMLVGSIRISRLNAE